MKTNLLLHICATVLLCGMPVFSAEPVVDFDGKNTDRKDVKTFFAENNPVLIPGAANGTVSEFIIRREILSESGEWAELRPIKSWVGENGALKNQYSFLPNHAARWTLKCLKGNWTAKHTYTLRPDQLGGHYHYDTPPPSLLVSSVSLSASTAPFHSALSPIIFQEMNGNTTYYYWQRYPVFSTRIVERFDFYGACQGNTQTDFINVEVPGLSELPYGDNYFLDNSQDAMGFHPDVHYESQKLIDTLMTVANEYKAAFPNAERIGIQDMSLPWGGMFDLAYDWSEPHYGHTIGADADINRAVVPPENRQKLLEIMCGLTPGIFLERDTPGEPPHYHLRVYGRTEFRLYDFLESDERVISCCKGNVVDPVNLQACVYARN